MSTYEFYMKCASVLSCSEALRQVFLEYFPLVQEGKVYSFEDVKEPLKSDIELLFMEAFQRDIPQIIVLSFEFFDELIPRTAKGSNWSHLIQYYGSLSCLKHLHELGLELEQINDIGGMFDSTMAVLCGQTEIVKYLLEMGANPCIRKLDVDETPLLAAYLHDKLEIAAMLANKTTVTMSLYPSSDDNSNILDLARKENKTEFINLFERIMQQHLNFLFF